VRKEKEKEKKERKKREGKKESRWPENTYMVWYEVWSG
jgi:hypothetical protein